MTMETDLVCFVLLLIPLVDGKIPRLCRERHGVPLEPDVFRFWTCAECYRYLFPGRILEPRYPKYLVTSANSSAAYHIDYVADINDDVNLEGICSTLTVDECQRWVACCQSAQNCCQQQLTQNISTTGVQLCPRTWDGWGCWGDTPKDTQAHISCPAFILYSIPSSYGIKKCNPNGTWFQNDGMEWTDYTPCLDKDGLIMTVYISLVCNVISIVLLVPSSVIFIGFRGLRRQHRIKVHTNFFLSFILSGLSVILWDILVTYDKLTNPSNADTRMFQNTIGCKVLSFLKIYSKSTNYMWMFCEGYYLHRLISNAFKPPSSLIPLYITAWGVPLLSSTIYSIFRIIYANKSCWAISFGDYEWIIYAPNLICLATNFYFLCMILRILTTQIHVHPNEPSSFRRALKATFVLLPLFGIQLFVTIYRLPPGTPGEANYEQFTIFVTNSQGFFVALLFCFFNGEVIGLLKQKCPCCRPTPSPTFATRRSLLEYSPYGSPAHDVPCQSMRMTPRNSQKDYASVQSGEVNVDAKHCERNSFVSVGNGKKSLLQAGGDSTKNHLGKPNC